MASIPYPVCIHQTTANRWNGMKQSRPLHICSEMVQNNGSVIWLFSGFGTPPTSKRCFGSGDMLHRAPVFKELSIHSVNSFFSGGLFTVILWSGQLLSTTDKSINGTTDMHHRETQRIGLRAMMLRQMYILDISISAANGKKTFLCQYAKSANGTALNFLLRQTSAPKIRTCWAEGSEKVDAWELCVCYASRSAN